MHDDQHHRQPPLNAITISPGACTHAESTRTKAAPKAFFRRRILRARDPGSHEGAESHVSATRFYAATIRSVYTRHCVYYVSRMKPTAICPDHRPDIASECDELDAASLFRRIKRESLNAGMNGKMIDYYIMPRKIFLEKFKVVSFAFSVRSRFSHFVFDHF